MTRYASWELDEGDEIAPGRVALKPLGGGNRMYRKQNQSSPWKWNTSCCASVGRRFRSQGATYWRMMGAPPADRGRIGWIA